MAIDPTRDFPLYWRNSRTPFAFFVNAKGNIQRIGKGSVPGGGDGNVYPLRMDPNTPKGAPVTLGNGPDTISLRLSSSPGATEGNYNVIAVQLGVNGPIIAGPLKVTAATGQDGGQLFNIRGDFPPAPLDIILLEVEEQLGILGLWWNGGNYNLDAFQYTGPSLNSRDPDSKIITNQPAAWDNKGLPMRLSTQDADEGPVIPPANSTIIEGALIDGAPTPAATLADLSAFTGAGHILLLPPGTFVGTAPMPGNTIQGSGWDKTILDATNLDEYHGKAILVPTLSGAKIMDLTLRGAAGPDNNVAGVRQDGVGISFSVERVHINGCQDGVLTFAAPLMTFTDCVLEGNGAGNTGGGATHEAYFNGDLDTVVKWLRVHSICGPKATHAYKSRAATNEIVDSMLVGNPGQPDGGAVIDLPHGGNTLIQRTTIQGMQGAPNRTFLIYAVDVQTNLGTVELNDVDLVYAPGEEWYFTGAPGVGGRLVISGKCTYPKGCIPPVFAQWGSVEGAFVAAD